MNQVSQVAQVIQVSQVSPAFVPSPPHNLLIARRVVLLLYIGGWGGSPTGKSFRFVRACERARRGEAAWASERRFDPVAGAVRGKFGGFAAAVAGEIVPGCPVVSLFSFVLSFSTGCLVVFLCFLF